MDAFLFAMPPPAFFPVQVVGIGLALLFAAAFARSAYSRPRTTYKNSGRLGFMALLGGPLLGLLFACLFFAMEDVNPLDVNHYLVVYIGVGSFAGLITATVFGLSALTTYGRQPPSKPPGDVWDREMDGGR